MNVWDGANGVCGRGERECRPMEQSIKTDQDMIEFNGNTVHALP